MIHLWKYLPAFKGKKRLIRFLYKKTVSHTREVTFRLNHSLVFSVPNLKENISFELFFEGSYEKSLAQFLIKAIPSGGIFIDIGANIGAISVFVARLRPDITIYAFEASPRVFSFLSRNVTQNKLDNITPINKAVHTEHNIFLDFFSPEEQFGKGSFSSVFTSVAEQVNTIRLDRFFEDTAIVPDIIKVDVEGFEALIFESLGQYLTTSSKRPILIFEFVDWAEDLSKIFQSGDGQKFILNCDYSLYDFDVFPGRNRCKNNHSTDYRLQSVHCVSQLLMLP